MRAKKTIIGVPKSFFSNWQIFKNDTLHDLKYKNKGKIYYVLFCVKNSLKVSNCNTSYEPPCIKSRLELNLHDLVPKRGLL